MFQVQLQNHMAAVKRFSNQSRRNCACFTPDGVVYTKKAKRNQKRGAGRGRNKRETENVAVDDNNDELTRYDMPSEMHYLLRLSRAIDEMHEQMQANQPEHRSSRRKRETVDHISAVIQEIQSSLEQLEQSSAEDTGSSANGTAKIGAKCFVQPNGKVNCSNIIYEDERSWRKSRNQIDLLIQVLKTKIVELKGIKKHLKHNKPSILTDDEDDSSEEDSTEDVTTKKESTISTVVSTEYEFNTVLSTTAAFDVRSSSIVSASEPESYESSSMWQSKSTMSTLHMSTESPVTIASKPGHRTRNNTTVHKQQHHNAHRNGTVHHRRTSTAPDEANSSTTNRPLDHRRNTVRHSKHNATTKRRPVSTTAMPSSSTTASPPPTENESSPSSVFDSDLRRMGSVSQSSSTTTAVDALITHVESIKDGSSTTAASTQSYTGEDTNSASGSLFLGTTQGMIAYKHI